MDFCQELSVNSKLHPEPEAEESLACAVKIVREAIKATKKTVSMTIPIRFRFWKKIVITHTKTHVHDSISNIFHTFPPS